MTAKKKAGSAREHRSTMAKTYLTMGIACFCMIVINLYAYFTIVRMSEMYSQLQNTAINIKFTSTNVSLVFWQVLSGYTEKDMNAIWSLFKELENHEKFLENEMKGGETDSLKEKIQTFRHCLVECNNINKQVKKGEPIDTAKIAAAFKTYDEAFSALINESNRLDSTVNTLIVAKLKTFKMLYVALIVNFVLLFAFIIYTIFQYTKKREMIEIELRETRENLETILNTLHSMVIRIDDQGEIAHWNSATEKYLGKSFDQVLTKKAWEAVPFLKSYQDKIDRVGLSKKPVELYRERVVDGNSEHFYNMMFSSISQTSKGVVVTVDDVTQLEIKESQLRQSQKMEVVENLIGGLAHDFNNVLGAITGTISMLRYSLESKDSNIDEIKGNIDIIESSAERAVVMVQQLLSLSTKHEIALVPIDLNSSVRHVIKICKNTLDKRIALTAELFDARVLVKADSAQIEQVLLNLCDNAAQAMTIMRAEEEEAGGDLVLAIDRVYPDREYRERHPNAVENSYWILSVQDSGVGMNREMVEKIFDPFFSTKGQEHGTGLGLTMVNDVVKQHQGFVEVNSEVGKGTTFSIFLPELILDEKSEKKETIQEEEQIPVGTGTIFVVDDEPVMRKTAKGILKKLGYDVVFAEDGEQAVEVFQENHGQIICTLLDMAMPKKSGKEAYIEMKKINPDLKVILISGFAKDKRIQEVLDLGVNTFIKKPYSMVNLAQEIKKLVGNVPPPDDSNVQEIGGRTEVVGAKEDVRKAIAEMVDGKVEKPVLKGKIIKPDDTVMIRQDQPLEEGFETVVIKTRKPKL